MKKEETASQSVNAKTLTKSSVWDVQENDIFRMLDTVDKDAELKENLRHFMDIIRSAFMMEELKDDDKNVKKKYEKQTGNTKNISENIGCNDDVELLGIAYKLHSGVVHEHIPVFHLGIAFSQLMHGLAPEP